MGNDVLIAAIINAVVCLAVAFQCACRARFMDRSTPWHYRHAYTLLGASSACAAWAWWWVHPWLHLLVFAAFANVLYLNSGKWPLRRKDDHG